MANKKRMSKYLLFFYDPPPPYLFKKIELKIKNKYFL